jgi:DNA-binding PadR family transcriptional regulator
MKRTLRAVTLLPLSPPPLARTRDAKSNRRWRDGGGTGVVSVRIGLPDVLVYSPLSLLREASEVCMPRLPGNQRTIMELLAKRGRLHAYEVKRILRGEIGHGSVYAALSAIQAKGLAEAEWELPGPSGSTGGPPRKYFTLTAAGREALLADTQAERRRRRRRSPLVSESG